MKLLESDFDGKKDFLTSPTSAFLKSSENMSLKIDVNTPVEKKMVDLFALKLMGLMVSQNQWVKESLFVEIIEDKNQKISIHSVKLK